MAHEDKNPLFSERVREQLLLRRILVLDGVLDDDNGTLLATQLLPDPLAEQGVLVFVSHASSLRHRGPRRPRTLL